MRLPAGRNAAPCRQARPARSRSARPGSRSCLCLSDQPVSVGAPWPSSALPASLLLESSLRLSVSISLISRPLDASPCSRCHPFPSLPSRCVPLLQPCHRLSLSFSYASPCSLSPPVTPVTGRVGALGMQGLHGAKAPGSGRGWSLCPLTFRLQAGYSRFGRRQNKR